MNKVLTRLAGAALVFVIMLGVNMYTPIIGEHYDFSTRDVDVVDTAVDNSGYCISWISGSAEKVAYADPEIQEIDLQSVYQNALYFLAYTYNLPVTDMVTGDILPYNVYDDTSGVFHNWTISDAQGQRQSFFNFIKGLTGGIIDWDVMAAAYSAVQLDFEVGTYRLLYDVFYTENNVTQNTLPEDVTAINVSTGRIEGQVNWIKNYTNSIASQLQNILIPNVISGFSDVSDDIGDAASLITDEISDLGVTADLISSRAGQILDNTIDIENYLNILNSETSDIDTKLSTTNNNLNVIKQYTSHITEAKNKLEAIRAYLVTIPAVDYTQRLTQILNAIQGQTISVDDRGIISAVDDMHDDVVEVLEEISGRIKTIGGDIISAIQDQQVNVTVPAGSIANVADYSYKLDNIISLLENLLSVAYDFNPANDYMNGFYPDIANYLMETVIPNIDSELQSKMPFGIPALVSSCIQVFRNAQPVAPSATVPIPDGQGNTVSLTLSLAQWSGIQHVTYFISVLLFVLALAMATKKLVFWNGG